MGKGNVCLVGSAFQSESIIGFVCFKGMVLIGFFNSQLQQQQHNNKHESYREPDMRIIRISCFLTGFGCQCLLVKGEFCLN